MLDIPCPQIEFRDNLDVFGKSIAEINLIMLNSTYDFMTMIRTMAHEIRHIWQYIYYPEYSESYVNSNINIEKYLNCIAENDAEAFASKLLWEITGVDDIKNNEEYAMGNKKIKKKIMKMRDTVVLDYDYVYIIKGLLGYLD